jgi:hypothetical protein
MNPKELAELQPADLSSWLVERARDAREFVATESFSELRDILTLVRNAAAHAVGTNLWLLEVAEAFVAPLAGRNLGRREIEVQRFLGVNADAERLLAGILTQPISGADELRLPTALREGVQRLVAEGVLLRAPQGLVVAPSMLGPLRELLSPPPFRLWAAVDKARVESANLSEKDAALLIAGRVGVTVQEARRYLANYPLPAHRPRRPPREAEFVPSLGDQGLDVPQDAPGWALTEVPTFSLDRSQDGQRN